MAATCNSTSGKTKKQMGWRRQEWLEENENHEMVGTSPGLPRMEENRWESQNSTRVVALNKKKFFHIHVFLLTYFMSFHTSWTSYQESYHSLFVSERQGTSTLLYKNTTTYKWNKECKLHATTSVASVHIKASIFTTVLKPCFTSFSTGLN